MSAPIAPVPRNGNGYTEGAARIAHADWRKRVELLALNLYRADPEYQKKHLTWDTVCDAVWRDLSIALEQAGQKQDPLYRGYAPPTDLTPSELQEEALQAAEAAYRWFREHERNDLIVSNHGYLQGREEQKPSDPIEQAIDQALTAITDIASGIQFERTDAFLERTRVERGKSVVLIDKALRSRNLSMLCGRAWSGKTTLATFTARCLVLQEPWFGLEVMKPCNVGYMALERNGEEVAAVFEQWQIADKVAFKDQVPIGTPREMAMALGYAIRRQNLEVVFIDHLVGLIQMEDGNDYVGVSKALAPFNAVAKLTGAHIFLLHHQPKTSGTSSEINVMGSEAFRAATDMLCETTKIGGNYFFRAQSRGQPDIERIRINRSSEGILLGEAGAEGLKSEIVQVLEAADCAKTASGILELSPELKGIPNKTFLMALNRLAKNNELYRTGKGRRGSPYYYSLRPEEDTEFRRKELKK